MIFLLEIQVTWRALRHVKMGIIDKNTMELKCNRHSDDSSKLLNIAQICKKSDRILIITKLKIFLPSKKWVGPT